MQKIKENESAQKRLKEEEDFMMSANVESMFYVRETPWHGLGTRVMEVPDSRDALIAAGLDWNVVQEPIYTAENALING